MLLNILQCTGQAPEQNNHPAQNANNAKVENLWTRIRPKVFLGIIHHNSRRQKLTFSGSQAYLIWAR